MVDIVKLLEKELHENLKKAAIWCVSGIREKLNRSQRIRGKGSKRRGVDPSKRGEWPKRVRGNLIRSVTFRFESELVTLIGSSLRYGAVLELSKTLDRSFIHRFLIENADKIKHIIQTGKP
jgi:hypothetical protein